MDSRVLLIFSLLIAIEAIIRKPEDKTKCPRVKSIRNFDVEQLLGKWFVVQYYASSEEALLYKCMQANFSMSKDTDITMNFNYSFIDDPLNEKLVGNITWSIPDYTEPAHWIHSEDIYEGVYNTYVLDSDYSSWALLLHCAEKSKSPRYLSSFIMSREPLLGVNVISYLRDKLPRYDIDLTYMFNMTQNECDIVNLGFAIPPSLILDKLVPALRRHPMKSHHGDKK